jgi:uncharacterized protein YuzE
MEKSTFDMQLDLDEAKDTSIINELLSRSKDYRIFARKMTEYFSKKYGSEFKGNILFEYDATGNVIAMTCFDQERMFEVEDELPEIAMHLKFLRKSAARLAAKKALEKENLTWQS